jgi:2-hydroxy-3-oxopropionate reductase|tara:strand:+ start:14589 stop:15482 length:894 start_codon:yes stop_codon:yes gene_type:complete
LSDLKQIGFIGLGIMGKPIAKNLIKAGFELQVHSRSNGPVKELVALGAKETGTPAECAKNMDAVITMLPDGPDSESVILGENGVLDSAKKGAIIIDMSSIAPAISQKIAKSCETSGAEFLDAPVSGGEPGAIEGTLAIMVGGKQSVFDSSQSIFDSVGSSYVLCGDYGAGNTTKLANQIIVATNIAAVGEALVLAKKAGLEPQKVFDAIKGGLAGSNVLNAKGPMMISGNFNPGFRIKLHHKDIRNSMLTGSDLGVSLPVTSLVQQIIVSLVNEGKGELDHSAIANFVEKINDQSIS